MSAVLIYRKEHMNRQNYPIVILICLISSCHNTEQLNLNHLYYSRDIEMVTKNTSSYNQNTETQYLDKFIEQLSNDETINLDIWISPSTSESYTREDVRIYDIKNANNEKFYRNINNRNRIIEIMNFFLDQYKNSINKNEYIKNEIIDENHEFEIARSWFEFCSIKSNKCLIIRLPDGIQQSSEESIFQIKIQEGNNYKIFPTSKVNGQLLINKLEDKD